MQRSAAGIEEMDVAKRLMHHGFHVLKNAPHTAESIASADWSHPYSREEAAFPLPFVRANKF